MSNDHTALVLALGAGAGLGLWALLRDDRDPAAGALAAPTPAASGASTAPPCSLRLDAKGLTADGAAIDVPTAVETCRAAGRADLVLADDAPSAAYAELTTALGAAGILIARHRNARQRRSRAATGHRRRRQAARKPGARSDLAALGTLAARLRVVSSARQGSGRREAAARLARFVAKHSGARVNDDATIDFENNVVVNGTPGEMRKVAAWVERLAIDSGRPVSATVETFDDPDDPDWAVCRIRGLGL